jgi:N-methylhydantoinase A
MAVVAEQSRLYTVHDALDVAELFAREYVRRFGAGSQSPEAGIRITTVRVASYVDGETVEFDASLPDGQPRPAIPLGSRQCHFPGISDAVDTPVFDETSLQPGLVIRGPAVAITPTTTYLVEPGWRLETGAHGAIWFLKNATAGDEK